MMATSFQRCAAIAIAMITSFLVLLFTVRATAQAAGQTVERVQLAGTPVTLVPMAQMNGGRPAKSLTSRDGPYLWAFGLTFQDYQDLEQRARESAERHIVSLQEWRAGSASGMLSRQTLDHGIAVELAFELIVRNGPLAALVVARVPVAALAADPSLDAQVVAMLDTVALTDNVLTPLESFEITPPNGFTIVGERGGSIQEFKNSHSGGLAAIRLIPSTEVDPERTERAAKVAFGHLEADFVDFRFTHESRLMSDDKWTYSERFFEAVTREGGRRVHGIERDQTNLTSDRFVAMAFSTTGWSVSDEIAARRAIESIWIGR